MKYLIAFIFLFPLYTFAAGGTYTIESKLYKSQQEIDVVFDVPKCVDDLQIIPNVQKGDVQIFDEEFGLWVGSFYDLNNYPLVKEKMKIKILGIENSAVDLSFTLRNSKNGQVWKSDATTLFFSDAFEEYILRINKNLGV